MATETHPSPEAGESERESPPSPAPAWHAVARGVSLFLGGFLLVQIAGDVRHAASDADFWWLDMRPYSPPLARGFVALVGTLLVLYALCSGRNGLLRGLCLLGTVLLLSVAGRDVYHYYVSLREGRISTEIPLPFSLHLAASLTVVVLALLTRQRPSRNRLRMFFVLGVTVAVCAIALPLAHIYCSGTSDSRRQADVAVVFGHHPSTGADAQTLLSARVGTACQLYSDGLAKKLILVAGPGERQSDEGEQMRRHALELDVPAGDIIVAAGRGDTRDAVVGSLELIRQHEFDSVLVVSHFYHLPRISLIYRRLGLHVWTVPATNGENDAAMPQTISDEFVALWRAYLEPLGL